MNHRALNTKTTRAGIIVLILFSTLYSLSAQVEENTQASIYAEKARDFKNKREFDSAEYFFSKAITFSNSEPLKTTSYQIDLASLYITSGRFPQARTTFKYAQSLIEDLNAEDQELYDIRVVYYNQLGSYHNALGRYDSAIFFHNKELEVHKESSSIDSTDYATVLSNLGLAHYNIRELNASLAYEEEAYAIKKRLLSPDDERMAISYRTLGLLALELSHSVEDALNYMKESLRVIEKHSGKRSQESLRAMQYLALCYDAAQEDVKAIEVLNSALDLALELNTGYNMGTAQLYMQIGGSLKDLGKYDESIDYYKQYKEYAKQVKGQDMRYPNANANFGLGMVYAQIDKYDLSEESLAISEGLFVQLFGPVHPILANIHNQRSRNARAQNKIGKALEYTKKAIEANSYDRSIFMQDSIPLSWLALYPIEFTISYVDKTHLLFDKYFQDSEEGTIEEGWQTFYDTEELLKEGLTKQKNISSLEVLQKFNSNLYGKGIETLWKQDSLSHSSRNFERMWAFSEKSKALNQKLKQRKRILSNLGFVPTELLSEESKIDEEISNSKTILIRQGSSDSIQSRLFQLQQDKKALQARVKKESPKNYELLFEIDGIKLDEVKAKLNPEQILVDYFVSENYVFAFLISSDGVTPYRLNTTSEINKKVELLTNSLTQDKGKSFGQAAFDLYEIIFKPFADEVSGSDLIIVPNKGLWNVNFDLLLTSTPVEDNPKNYDYLLNKYSISYANSASLLFKQPSKKRSSEPLLALAFGENNEKKTKLENLRDVPKGNLPGTAKEVLSLAKTVKGDFYYGKDANEATFKESASDYTILHLALHGEVDHENPDNSKLYFTPDSTSLEEDNTLHTFELYGMNLNADLAVLSACNTGAGKLKNGEGIISLGNAFQYAGVNSVLLSQWEVSDATAPILMNSFYNNLKEGMSKSESLRQAKLEFLKNSNNITSNPYYWGSFFIVGNPDPINLNPKSNQWYWIVGLLMLLILIIYRKRIGVKTAT